MKLLAMLKTGEGKTHIIQCWGGGAQGICLIIHPILALTADQVLKFTKDPTDMELSKPTTWTMPQLLYFKKIIAKMKRLKPSTTNTMFLFCSPQFLANTTPFLNVVLRAAIGCTLRNVIADKVHLFVIHGLSFREEIRKLNVVFYKPVFSQKFPPIFIALTATMSKSNLKQLLHLTTIYFPDRSKLWGGGEAFEQHNISLSQHCGSEYNAQLDLLASYLLPLLIQKH